MIIGGHISLQDELLSDAMEHAFKLGASYVDVRIQDMESERITVENGTLREYQTDRLKGVGVRVIVNKSLGLASSTIIDKQSLVSTVDFAVSMAKASNNLAKPTVLSSVEPKIASSKIFCDVHPSDVSPEEKIRLTTMANKAAFAVEGVTNSRTILSWFHDVRDFTSAEGAEVNLETNMVGYAQLSVALHEGKLEQVSDSRSKCSGFEFMDEQEFQNFAKETSELANKAVKSRTPKTGKYEVVADPRIIGVILHEAFGHASEGDLVRTNESILTGMLGKDIANDQVTIIDDGLVKDGFFVPYDDEGVKKAKQVVVEEGILVGYLHSRGSAEELHSSPTGNGRAQGFSYPQLVRQTNLFMEKGNCSLEELIEDIDNGLYILGRGAGGGEVDVGQGAFTFKVGPSFIIKKGELDEMVRGVSISGMILDTLRGVTGVGKETEIRTSVFGGCGKSGQTVRVGLGGPHVKIREMLVGGS